MEYIVKNGGFAKRTWTKERGGGLMAKDTPLSNFTAEVVATVTYTDGEKVGEYILIHSDALEDIEIPANRFDDVKAWTMMGWGAGAIIYPRGWNGFRKAVQQRSWKGDIEHSPAPVHCPKCGKPARRWQ